jgi:hypothetical protein
MLRRTIERMAPKPDKRNQSLAKIRGKAAVAGCIATGANRVR